MQKVLRGIFLLVGLFFSTTLFAGEIVWQKDITAAFEKAQKENKVVMVMVGVNNVNGVKKCKSKHFLKRVYQKDLNHILW